MKKIRLKKVIASMLAICVFSTSVSWGELTARAVNSEGVNGSDLEQSRVNTLPIESEDISVENEIADERTTYSSVYDLGNHKKMEVFYGSEVRFKDEHGNLVEYDSSLVEINNNKSLNGESLEGYSYTNAQGDRKNYIPQILSEETPILLEKQGYSISFFPVKTNDAVAVKEEAPEQDSLDKYNSTEKAKLEEQQYESSEGEVFIETGEQVIEISETEDKTNFSKGQESIQGRSENRVYIDSESEINRSDTDHIEQILVSDVEVQDQQVKDIHGEEEILPMTAVYQNELADMKWEYESSDIGIKENIVLNNVPEQNYFTHEFHLKG